MTELLAAASFLQKVECFPGLLRRGVPALSVYLPPTLLLLRRIEQKKMCGGKESGGLEHLLEVRGEKRRGE